MGPRTRLERFGKSRPHRDSIPESFYKECSINYVKNYEFNVLVSNFRLIHVEKNYICKFLTLRITLHATV